MKKRYRILYTPSGAAGEYADHGYAANLFMGCLHGCQYCYAPGTLRLERSVFHAAMTAKPNLLKRLEKDLVEVGTLPEPIFLCFTCDPYPESKELRRLTRSVISLILESHNAVNILTKGGMYACNDFDLLEKNDQNRIGATLTFINHDDSHKWEPHASLPGDRIIMLETAHKKGIKTWASMEPVIDPTQTLNLITASHRFVDEYKIGKLNHCPAIEKKIDWPRFRQDVIMLCDHLGVKYIIKQSLGRTKSGPTRREQKDLG